MSSNYHQRIGNKLTRIKGVETKELVRHHDPRGHFQENIRVTDPFFKEGFGQWSESVMYQGVVKAWHIHQHQVDWWYCSEGVIKAVLCDLREVFDAFNITSLEDLSKFNNILNVSGKWTFDTVITFSEYILGLPDDPFILKIPPGAAHGCKVLQGPAKLSYITSEVHNPDDEGRIPYDALGYDWHKTEIK